MRTLELPYWAMQMSLEDKWRRLKGAMATPFMRRLLRRPSHLVARNELAAHFVRGDGIEVGALNAPMTFPAGARVRYVDLAPHRDYGEIGGATSPP